MANFYDKLVSIADNYGNGYSGSRAESNYINGVLNSRGYHPDFEKAEHYKSLSRDERDNNLDAIRDNRIYGDGRLGW